MNDDGDDYDDDHENDDDYTPIGRGCLSDVYKYDLSKSDFTSR